eukprot:scaffold46863_cov31-Phaeocystis_antarctica.AAC.1
MLRLAAAEQSACLGHATAKASLQNHFDGAGEAGDAGAAQTSQQAGACTPAVTVAHAPVYVEATRKR